MARPRADVRDYSPACLGLAPAGDARGARLSRRGGFSSVERRSEEENCDLLGTGPDRTFFALGFRLAPSAKEECGAVAEYIACVVGDDDHVISFLTFICDTDASAMARAKQLAKGHDVVLWSGERIVTRIIKAQQSPDLPP